MFSLLFSRNKMLSVIYNRNVLSRLGINELISQISL